MQKRHREVVDPLGIEPEQNRPKQAAINGRQHRCRQTKMPGARKITATVVAVDHGCYGTSMRKIGQLRDERQARLFSDALYARGLDNDVESEEDGAFSIWVHDDDQLTLGRELMEKFVLGPDAAEWQAAPGTAARKRKEEERAEAKRASNVITRERLEYERNFGGFAWVPMVFVILSVIATVWAGELSLMGQTRSPRMTDDDYSSVMERVKRRDALFITTALVRREVLLNESGEIEAERYIQPSGVGANPLPEIRQGQVWRLFTPILVHFGLLHLIFNIIWLRNLGGFMQHRFSGAYLLVFILTVAAVSNLVQLAWSGPRFGGLSGVNYGLLGFLWMRGRFDRFGAWQINPQIVQWMIVWFFLCFFTPGVANGAHTAGLLFGMITGFTTAKISNARNARA
jgi:GlpG protein